MAINESMPLATPAQEPMLLASVRTGGGLTHLKDLTVYEGSRPVGLVRLFKDESTGKVWAYGQNQTGRAPRYDVSGKSENQIRYGSYTQLRLYSVQYNMDDIARGVGLLSGSSPEKAKNVGYDKIGRATASFVNQGAQNVSAMTGQSIGPVLTYEDDAKNTWQAIERNVLPRYGASSIDEVLASRRFYADPVLAKHVEDASRSYSKAGLNFAQVLDGARQNKGLGTYWMQRQHQSQGRGYVDEQVGRLHNTLQAYMQGQATRQQLNAAVAQFRSNIEGQRLVDVLTPDQVEAWKSAQYELSPTTRTDAKHVGVTLKTLDGQSRQLIGEVHVKSKLERNGQWTIAGAALERVTYDMGTDLVGSKGHKNLGANSINVGVSNGLRGKPLGAPLKTWSDVELATRDALQGGVPGILAADARAQLKAMSQTSISQGLPKILQQVLPDGGGPVKPLLKAFEGVGTGGNKFSLDAVRGTIDTALTALSGFGELVNVTGAATGVNGGKLLIPAAHEYASKFRQGLLDMTAFVDAHRDELPGMAGTAIRQQVDQVKSMLDKGDIAGAAEKLTYVAATLVTLVWGTKQLPAEAAQWVEKFKEVGSALKQFRNLPAEAANVLRPGGSFRLGQDSFKYTPPVAARPTPSVVKPPTTAVVATPAAGAAGAGTGGGPVVEKLNFGKDARNNIQPIRRNDPQPSMPQKTAGSPSGAPGNTPPTKTPVAAEAAAPNSSGANPVPVAAQPQPVFTFTPVKDFQVEPSPAKATPQTKIEPRPTSATAQPPREIRVFDRKTGNDVTNDVPPDVAAKLANGEEVPEKYSNLMARRVGNGSKGGQTGARPPSSSSSPDDVRPSDAGADTPSSPPRNTPTDESGVGGAGTGNRPPGNASSAASGAPDEPDPQLRRIFDEVAAARQRDAGVGAYFYDPTTKQLRLVQTTSRIRAAHGEGSVFVRSGHAVDPPGTREIAAAIGAQPIPKPEVFQKIFDDVTVARQLDRANGAHFFNPKTGAKHFTQTEGGVRQAHRDGLVYVKAGRADQVPSLQEARVRAGDPDFLRSPPGEQRPILPRDAEEFDAGGYQAEGFSSDDARAVEQGLFNREQSTPRGQLRTEEQKIYDEVFGFDDPAVLGQGDRYLDMEGLLKPVLGAPDRLMVRHRMLEKYGEFKVLRDEPIGPNRFRFVEYRLDAQGQPIVRPDAITKTNDYFIGGKRVAWYDRQTNKINVDSEAMQQWGITQPGLPANQQDPVLKALWDSMTTTQEGALSEPSVPMRNIKTVLNYNVDEVGKVRYEAHPDRQNGDIKSLLGAPSHEKLLSRRLSNGEIEYYNPGKTERTIIQKTGLDQPGRERELNEFITRRRAWARQVMYLNQHGGQSPMEINNWLARDRIGTLGGYWNGSRLQTIYGMNGSGIMPMKSDRMWRNMRYTSVENLDVKLFGHSRYSAAEQTWREPVITPIITRAASMRSEWQKNISTVAWFSSIATGAGAIYIARDAIEATLKGQTQNRFLNTADNAMLYGIDAGHMPPMSPSDMARLGMQLSGKPSADAAALNMFSKGADGRPGLKGTTNLQREYDDAIKQYTAQTKLVTELGLEVGRSAKPSGQAVDKLNQAIAEADRWLDRADLALRSRQMLLQLWSVGFQTASGQTVVPRRDSVTPAYITNELRSIETTQSTVVGYRTELQKGKQAALTAAQSRSDTLVTQDITKTNAETAKQNLEASRQGVETAKQNLAQSKTGLAETQENNRRSQSRDAFNKWSAPIDAANTTYLRGYGDAAPAAPRITIAGVQEVVLQPPIVNGVALTLDQRLDNTLARVRTFPADGFYWARTQLGVPDAQLQQQLSGARQGLIDAHTRFESQFGRRGGAPGGSVAPGNESPVPKAQPTAPTGAPLSDLPVQEDEPSDVYMWQRRPLLASLTDSNSTGLLAQAEKKNEPVLTSVATNKVSFSELTLAAQQKSIQAQAATLEVLSAVRSRKAAGGLPDITGSAGLSFPLMPSLGFNITVIDPGRGPLKQQLDAKIAVAQAAQVDVGAQVALETAQHLNQAQIQRLQIERDGAKLRAIDEALADVQARIGAGVASAADTVPLIEDKDKLNLSLSQNQQSLERELNMLAQLSGRTVSADSLPALKASPGTDFVAQQPALPPFDSRTAGTDAETLIQQFGNRQNTQVARLEKEIDAAEAALKVAQSQRKPKLSIGFSFPFIPSIRISGGNTVEVREQIAEAERTLKKARLTLEDFKLRNATEIRGAAGRARADDPNVNDSSWQQRIANADDLLFGSKGANGARSGGLLAAYQQAVAAYQAGTASKADVLKPYLLLVDALHNRASSSLSLVNDVATLRYAIGELDTAQEQATLFKQLDGLLDPGARVTRSVPLPVFGDMR